MNNIAENRTFFTMHSGENVYPSVFEKTQISLDDIAHHLASPKNYRFGGALDYDKHYSVALHSITMALYARSVMNKDIARACLLHDATEAYMGDVVSPLKRELADYQLLEAKLAAIIYDKYNIAVDKETVETVKIIDRRILLDEVKALLPQHYEMFQGIYSNLAPLGVEINSTLSPYEVKEAFLKLAEYLNIRD